MVRTRKAIYVGNQEVKRRYIGNKLIFESLDDMDDKVKVSGTEIFTDKADNSVVHVDVDGKSYQHAEPTPDYPIEIESVNDFVVVSSRAINMFNSEDFIKNGIGNGLPEDNTTLIEVDGHPGFQHGRIPYAENYFDYLEGQFEESTSYTLSFEYDFTGNNELARSGMTINYTTGTFRHIDFWGFSDSGKVSIETDPKLTVKNITLRGWSYQGSFKVWKISLIKTSDFKGHIPHAKDITPNADHPLIDKINLSLSGPLRSVGDVKDRLFRDSDGFWKIERNVEVTGTEDGTQSIADAYSLYEAPVIEVLSGEYQNKLNNLRSFQDSNYVYTISDNDISPTLHATFKSKNWYDDYQDALLK